MVYFVDESVSVDKLVRLEVTAQSFRLVQN